MATQTAKLRASAARLKESLAELTAEQQGVAIDDLTAFFCENHHNEIHDLMQTMVEAGVRVPVVGFITDLETFSLFPIDAAGLLASSLLSADSRATLEAAGGDDRFAMVAFSTLNCERLVRLEAVH